MDRESYPRCKTCKWWGKDYDLDGVELPDIAADAIHTNASMCCHPKQGIWCDDATDHYQGAQLIDFETVRPLAADETAVIVGDDRFGSAYWTGPDHGCLLHSDFDKGDER